MHCAQPNAAWLQCLHPHQGSDGSGTALLQYCFGTAGSRYTNPLHTRSCSACHIAASIGTVFNAVCAQYALHFEASTTTSSFLGIRSEDAGYALYSAGSLDQRVSAMFLPLQRCAELLSISLDPAAAKKLINLCIKASSHSADWQVKYMGVGSNRVCVVSL